MLKTKTKGFPWTRSGCKLQRLVDCIGYASDSGKTGLHQGRNCVSVEQVEELFSDDALWAVVLAYRR